MNDLIELFNPATYMDPEAYLAWWRMALSTVLTGWLARVLASVGLFYSFWYGVYKQRFSIGLVFFLATMAVAYGASIAWVLRP
jgi:hypothetical protein